MDADEVEGLGVYGADEPNSFFASGIEEAGDSSQTSKTNPLLHLLGGGAAGGENGESLFGGDPAGFDPGERFLPGVRMDAKPQSALGQGRSISFNGRRQPASGGKVVILG